MSFKVSSSAISSVSYDKETRTLSVAFTSNPAKFYDFYNVPPRVVREFVKADSCGRYYHRNIRGKFMQEKEIIV